MPEADLAHIEGILADVAVSSLLSKELRDDSFSSWIYSGTYFALFVIFLVMDVKEIRCMTN